MTSTFNRGSITFYAINNRVSATEDVKCRVCRKRASWRCGRCGLPFCQKHTTAHYCEEHTFSRRLLDWILAFFRLSDRAVCRLSAEPGLPDYHDYPDSEAGEPVHFVPLYCSRCGKEFYI